MNYNKSFVQIPIQSFVNMISYKAELQGIKVVKQIESYTSGVSAVDLEPVNKNYYNKSRRITRGLFKTNSNIYINADINGSLNIMRKYLNDKCIPKLVLIARDKREVNSPCRIRIA